jgi:hypothetical protein
MLKGTAKAAAMAQHSSFLFMATPQVHDTIRDRMPMNPHRGQHPPLAASVESACVSAALYLPESHAKFAAYLKITIY